jgi:hypothetical protein
MPRVSSPKRSRIQVTEIYRLIPIIAMERAVRAILEEMHRASIDDKAKSVLVRLPVSYVLLGSSYNQCGIIEGYERDISL